MNLYLILFSLVGTIGTKIELILTLKMLGGGGPTLKFVYLEKSPNLNNLKNLDFFLKCIKEAFCKGFGSKKIVPAWGLTENQCCTKKSAFS